MSDLTPTTTDEPTMATLPVPAVDDREHADASEVCRDRQQWLVLAALVITGHWASASVFHVAEKAWHSDAHVSMLWALLPLAALGLVSYALFRLRLSTPSRQRKGLQAQHMIVLGLAGFTIVSSFGAATSLERTVVALANGWRIEPWDFWGGVLYCVAFAGGAIRLFQHRNDLGAVTQFPIQRPSQKREHLILFLSFLNRVGSHQDGVPDWFLSHQQDTADVALVKRTGSIEEDLKRLMRHKPERRMWPWEMPLRSILHHTHTLKEVTIVCSSESLGDVHWFINLCHAYFPKETWGVDFFVWVRADSSQRFRRVACPEPMTGVPAQWGAFDFESLNALSAAIFELLDVLTEKGVRDRDIVIDFTGGQKTTSLVAACVTFNRLLHAQYVRTDGKFEKPGDDIISFDLTVDPVAAGMG